MPNTLTNDDQRSLASTIQPADASKPIVYSIENYERISHAIQYLIDNAQQQPSLKQVASALQLGEYHAQRLFSDWVGISPKRFLQFINKENAKKLLRQSNTVMDTSLSIGLSGSSRLHDLLVQCDAVTPGEYAYLGQGLDISYGMHVTPFGLCLIATTQRGICHLAFLAPGEEQDRISALKAQWPKANFFAEQTITKPFIERIFQQRHLKNPIKQPLYVLLKGTNFQIKVWQALLTIPPGNVSSYGNLAELMEQPKAARAVGSAVGKNNIGYIIPCHRVIQQTGYFGQYRWGKARKQLMLAFESTAISNSTS